MRETLIEQLRSRSDIELQTYIHADGEADAKPVDYDSLYTTFEEVDELRMDLESKGKTCVIFVFIDGHGENDGKTKLVLNTSRNYHRLFDIEKYVRSYASGNNTCYVFAYFNLCRSIVSGVASITQPNLRGEESKESVGNLIIKFTAAPDKVAIASESETEL